MFKPTLKIIFILFVLSGCSLSKPIQPATILPETPQMTRQASTLTRKATETPLQTPSITPTTLPTSFQIMQRCSSDTVNFQEMGIENYRLLVEPYNESEQRYIPPYESGILSISSGNLTPTIVPITYKPGWTFLDYYIEPNGKQLQLTFENNTSGIYALWRSRIDGQNQETIYEYNPQEVSLGRYYQDLLTVEENHDSRIQILISVIDWQHGKTYLLPENLESPYYNPFIISDTLYILYEDVQSSQQFMLYSESEQTPQPAFGWLDGKDWVWNKTTPILQNGNNLSVYVFRSYGFDFARNLSLSDILQSSATYTNVMQIVNLPLGNNKLLSMGNEIRQINSNNIFIKVELFEPSESRIYQIDFNKQLIVDYCLSLKELPSIEISPDGRFVAITNYDSDPLSEHGFDYPLEVVILDIETGKRSIIEEPRFQVVGWISND